MNAGRSEMTVDVFISYSHHDTALVSPVVKLLRINQSLVFHDVDSIEPGKKWREEITDALASARLVVLFWCIHSSKSKEVKAEYWAAIQSEKDVLPVILDATPLPEELKAFQWIDFRDAFKPHDSFSERARTLQAPPPAPKSKRTWAYGFMMIAIVVLSALAGRVYHVLGGPDIEVEAIALVLILLALLIIAMSFVVVRRIVVRRRATALRHENVCPEIDQFEMRWGVDLALWQRKLATELESQILNRVGSSSS